MVLPVEACGGGAAVVTSEADEAAVLGAVEIDLL
jgi:hypothetical protein